jgi:ATPase family associated with various cellular activities (AAA)
MNGINQPELERLGFVGFNVSDALDAELDWLEQVIRWRMRLEERKDAARYLKEDLPNPPKFVQNVTQFGNFAMQCSWEERVVISLALTAHLRPQLLDIFFAKNPEIDRAHTEYGGLKGKYHNGFLPTGETAAFIIAGSRDIGKKIECIDLFRPDFWLIRKNIIKYDRRDTGEPILSGSLDISDEYFSIFSTNQLTYKPDFSTNFPAKLLTTRLSWADLVLDPHVFNEVSELKGWIEHQHTIMNDWGLSKQLKRGYRALFYGPPGTGKSLTATLLGGELSLDVYRIDLSQVVSKYIGETEKNLASIFDQAENKNWILFFDEADALFGKRTATSDSKDRHANQEVAYLLQRIEDYSGVIILATNLKANMDIAFTRRFQSIIYFPAPNFEQRLTLWQNAFKHPVPLDEDVDFNTIANDYNITGGNIINVLRYCSLSSLRRGAETICMEDITEGIKRELRKEGKTM